MMKLKRSYFNNAFVPKYLPVIYFGLILHFLLIICRAGRQRIYLFGNIFFLFGKKSSGAAACRYSKKVAPLPLLACKTAAAAATLKK